FGGVRKSREFLLHQRRKLLAEQLKPTGEFCAAGGAVHSTGNGCYVLMGWLHKLLDAPASMSWGPDIPGEKWFKALNLPPTQEGRGMSEMFSLCSQSVADRLNETDGSSDEQ
ncbi:unnamed protein product, partial [Effrenium voratum]